MTSIYPRMQAATITETPAEPPRLLDRMRFTLPAKHYSHQTEQAYWSVPLCPTGPSPPRSGSQAPGRRAC